MLVSLPTESQTLTHSSIHLQTHRKTGLNTFQSKHNQRIGKVFRLITHLLYYLDTWQTKAVVLHRHFDPLANTQRVLMLPFPFISKNTEVCKLSSLVRFLYCEPIASFYLISPEIVS